jgi:signal transduction histidine kinase
LTTVLLTELLKDSARPSIRVTVSDHGPGLQGRSTETLCAWSYSTKADGLGMGLAICRHIVEDHGGVLIAGEAPRGGALFSFVIPIYQETKPKATLEQFPDGVPV